MEKEVFERLLIEYNELLEKINKLRNFILGDSFNEIDELNKDLCLSQLHAMETYISVLSIRLAYNHTYGGEDVVSDKVQ